MAECAYVVGAMYDRNNFCFFSVRGNMAHSISLPCFFGGFMGLLERIMNIGKGSRKHEQAPGVLPGRNEPCWCGSGKKYKKCHLPEEEKKMAAKACSLNCGPT
jgi:hypothetical protein